jgi:hypothetical protein
MFHFIYAKAIQRPDHFSKGASETRAENARRTDLGVDFKLLFVLME